MMNGRVRLRACRSVCVPLFSTNKFGRHVGARQIKAVCDARLRLVRLSTVTDISVSALVQPHTCKIPP